jgi:uncharacterized membrane protein (UPF0127 family)
MTLRNSLKENYKFRKIIVTTLLTLLSVFSLTIDTSDSLNPQITYTHLVLIDNHSYFMESATSADEQARGLMFRKEMPQNTGMLFIYPEEQFLSFWMKNTFISLDIIFLDQNLKIIKIHKATVPLKSSDIYQSEGYAQFVIEIPHSNLSLNLTNNSRVIILHLK